MLGEALMGAQIVHAFLGCETTYPWDGVKETSSCGRKYTRRRGDCSIPSRSLMFHSRWNTATAETRSDKVLAAYIRAIATEPERNTPTWFPDIVRTSAEENGYRIVWCGSTNSIGVQGNEMVLQGGALIKQIRWLASNAKCAVGLNSGGLDMAAAAGLPVLRVGEFQRLARWGARYNSFLACATCVGLEPLHYPYDAGRLDRSVVQKSLAAFLKNRNLFKSPRHVLLRHGEVLCDDPQTLARQLQINEILWPVCLSNTGS